jgi:hypothetical protein
MAAVNAYERQQCQKSYEWHVLPKTCMKQKITYDQFS